MNKPIIAVDIDDVLAATAEGFASFSNDKYGTNLTANDYSEHWAEIWQTDLAEVRRRAKEYHDSGILSRYRHYDEAKPVLKKLKSKYRLIAMTARETRLESITRAWMNEHFSGIFEEIQFAGIFDAPLHLGMLTQTKAELFVKNDVKYVIDDQLKHCLAAAELGIETILFGNYNWNQSDGLPAQITRCNDWAAVGEYFDARG